MHRMNEEQLDDELVPVVLRNSGRSPRLVQGHRNLQNLQEGNLPKSEVQQESAGYDDSDILPSSSSLNKSYPEFYGDQCLS